MPNDDSHGNLWSKLDEVEKQIHSSQLNVVERLTGLEARVKSVERNFSGLIDSMSANRQKISDLNVRLTTLAVQLGVIIGAVTIFAPVITEFIFNRFFGG